MKKDFKVLLVYANLMMDNMVPISISLLTACLKEKGFSVDIFDTTCYHTSRTSGDQQRVVNLQVKPFSFEEYGVKIKETDVYGDFYKKVAEYKPNLIGITVVEPTFNMAVGLLERVKSFKIPNILGGAHVVLDPESVMENEYVDMVCTCEGERLIVELCEAMYKDEDLSIIRGLWFKKDGRVIRNPRPLSLTDLDSIPYSDFSVFEKERFYKPMAGKIYKMVPLELTRGCPYNCYFCSAGTLAKKYSDIGRWYRQKSLNRIFNELDFYIKEHSAQYIYFVSETFLSMGKERFEEFARRYKKIGLPFWCNTRPETITEENVKLLEEMGCNRITLGIEHGNEEFRKRMMNRLYSNEEVVKAIEILKNSNIPMSVNAIIGSPDETRELIFDTIGLIRRLNLRKRDSISCLLLAPYKGTVMREICIQKGYIDKDINSPDHSVEYVLKSPIFTKEELFGLLRTFTAYCRLPEEHFPLIRKAEALTEEGNQSFEKVREVYNKLYFS